jgi:hypothetical protein
VNTLRTHSFRIGLPKSLIISHPLLINLSKLIKLSKISVHLGMTAYHSQIAILNTKFLFKSILFSDDNGYINILLFNTLNLFQLLSIKILLLSSIGILTNTGELFSFNGIIFFVGIFSTTDGFVV